MGGEVNFPLQTIGVISVEWKLSFIINCYKGKSNSHERRNFKGLELTDQILKKAGSITKKFIKQQVDTGKMKTDAHLNPISQEWETIKWYCKKLQNNEYLLALVMYYVHNKYLRKNWNLPLNFRYFHFLGGLAHSWLHVGCQFLCHPGIYASNVDVW